MTSTTTRVLALGAGAAVALAVDHVGTRLASRHLTSGYALGLVAAALVYPVARSSEHAGAPGRRELAAVAAYAGVTGLALQQDATRARQAVAVAWASHALFDAAHDRGEHSRLPGWYPELCAGFDLVVAGLLAGRPVQRMP